MTGVLAACNTEGGSQRSGLTHEYSIMKRIASDWVTLLAAEALVCSPCPESYWLPASGGSAHARFTYWHRDWSIARLAGIAVLRVDPSACRLFELRSRPDLLLVLRSERVDGSPPTRWLSFRLLRSETTREVRAVLERRMIQLVDLQVDMDSLSAQGLGEVCPEQEVTELGIRPGVVNEHRHGALPLAG